MRGNRAALENCANDKLVREAVLVAKGLAAGGVELHLIIERPGGDDHNLFCRDPFRHDPTNLDAPPDLPFGEQPLLVIVAVLAGNVGGLMAAFDETERQMRQILGRGDSVRMKCLVKQQDFQTQI